MRFEGEGAEVFSFQPWLGCCFDPPPGQFPKRSIDVPAPVGDMADPYSHCAMVVVSPLLYFGST